MNKDILKQAIDNLSINMICLRDTQAKLYNEFDPLVPGQEMVGQFIINTRSFDRKELIDEAGNVSKFFVYQTEARMRYLKGPIPEHLQDAQENNEEINKLVASEIIAVFSSEYSLKSDIDLDDSSLLEFGKHNVPHQVWPYWREYCQSTCSRMSLPIYVLPMYVINS